MFSSKMVHVSKKDLYCNNNNNNLNLGSSLSVEIFSSLFQETIINNNNEEYYYFISLVVTDKLFSILWQRDNYVILLSPTLDECRDVMRKVKQKGATMLGLQDSDHNTVKEIITNIEGSSVMYLNLSSCILNMSILSSALTTNSTMKCLKKLRMYSCHFTSQDISVLCIALYQHSELQGLDVSHNPTIGDEGASCIAAMLKVNKVLQEVYLVNCCITDTGVRELSEMLKINQTLRGLNLGGNNGITSLGAHYLSDMLLINTSLQRLSLWSTNIREDGATELCTALCQNQSVKILSLSIHLQTHCKQLNMYENIKCRLPFYF